MDGVYSLRPVGDSIYHLIESSCCREVSASCVPLMDVGLGD